MGDRHSAQHWRRCLGCLYPFSLPGLSPSYASNSSSLLLCTLGGPLTGRPGLNSGAWHSGSDLTDNISVDDFLPFKTINNQKSQIRLEQWYSTLSLHLQYGHFTWMLVWTPAGPLWSSSLLKAWRNSKRWQVHGRPGKAPGPRLGQGNSSRCRYLDNVSADGKFFCLSVTLPST